MARETSPSPRWMLPTIVFPGYGWRQTGGISSINRGYLSANAHDGLSCLYKGHNNDQRCNLLAGNRGYGADLQNQLADTPKAVTITNGNFNSNDQSGLNVLSKGAISLKNVNATEQQRMPPVDMGAVDTEYLGGGRSHSANDTFTFTGPAIRHRGDPGQLGWILRGDVAGGMWCRFNPLY